MIAECKYFRWIFGNTINLQWSPTWLNLLLVKLMLKIKMNKSYYIAQ